MRKFLLVFVLFSVFLASGCKDKNEEIVEEEEVQTPKRLATVKVHEAMPSLFIKKIDLVGSAIAKRTVIVSAEESGVVRELNFDKGDSVAKGKLLVRLDDDLLRASLKEVQASYEIEKLNHEKLAALKKGRGAVTEFDLRNALLKKDIAAARLENMRAKLKKKSIASPARGLVEKKHVEKGEFISPGMPVATIIDISTVKVEAAIAEKDMSYFKKGAVSEITFNAYPGEVFKGVVDFVSPDVDRTDGTFIVEISLDNSDGRLKPGMMATVSLEKSRCKDCLIIPQDAIVDAEEGSVVFVVTSDGVAHRRSVVTGETEKDKAIVESGLEAGDRVIIVGQRNIVDGERVKIVE